jgi:two-component system OmpR family sensor kinase
MSSLRARLLAAVLVVAAVGLLLLAAITYAEQRSYQLDRVDDQARIGAGAVEGALAERGIGEHAEPDRGRRGGGPPRGGGPGVGLPAGTYGQLRDANGRVIPHADVVFDYGQNVTARPAIPAKLAVGSARTVSGRKGDGTHYRVVATHQRGGPGITVVAIPLRDVDQRLNRLVVVEGFVIAGVLLLLAAVAWILVRVGLLPLDRIGHTASRIAGGDLSHRVAGADARTEVGRVGLALNAMLDRLERAFAERQASEDRLRQFIADASHELRTPLASIRGYAELFRMGAASEPADVEKSMRRIEDEAARMGVLVEDLLTLARLDEVADAPHTEVDLAELARDAADDARATAPGRAIAVAGDAPAVVLGDAHQLRQVLANLLRNALVHTPAASPVEVAVTASGTDVRLEVRDHGPGLPTDEPDALFERFWRAEGGRERGKSGAGLGLAIVAAIVGAHRGHVTAANADGGGAAFVVTLPAAADGATRYRVSA